MHVTPDSPVTDRTAVALANAVIHAGQDRPDPAAPPDAFDTHDGPWTPTADEWRRVCHLVDVLVADDAVNLLHSMVGRLVDRPAGIPAALANLVMVDHWHHADPLHRAAVLVRLAWQARTGTPARDEDDAVPDPARVEAARSLQDAARTTGDMLAWFGDPDFPVQWPDHAGAALARRLVDEADDEGATVASLHVALMLAAARHETAGGAV